MPLPHFEITVTNTLLPVLHIRKPYPFCLDSTSELGPMTPTSHPPRPLFHALFCMPSALCFTSEHTAPSSLIEDTLETQAYNTCFHLTSAIDTDVLARAHPGIIAIGVLHSPQNR